MQRISTWLRNKVLSRQRPSFPDVAPQFKKPRKSADVDFSGLDDPELRLLWSSVGKDLKRRKSLGWDESFCEDFIVRNPFYVDMSEKLVD